MESKYQGSEIRSEINARDIASITSNRIISQTDFNPISIARNAPGADEIVALAGAFSACKVRDWKAEKEQYLRTNA